MSIQDYLNLKVAIEEVMEQVGRSASSEAHRDANGNGTFSSMKQRWPLQPEDEERIYSKFLTDKLSEDEEDESDGEFIPPFDAEEDEADSDFDAVWEEHDTSSEQEISSEHSDDLHLYDNNSEEEEGEGDENAPTTPRSALGTLQDFLLDASFLSIFLTGQGRDTPLTRSQHRRTLVDANYDSDTPSDNEEGSAAFQTSDRRPQDITSIRSRRSRLDQRSKNYLQRRPSSRFQNGELLALLQKYRKTNTLLSTTAGPSGTVSSPSAAEGVSSACNTSTMSPPPMAELPPNPEDSSFYARLLCVVCQAEPRNILLRPCRCLALCNDCRELLAIRRFKQCPCCRSDVQGFSKIYLP
ncbi:hypothetical protein BGW42_008205 [Actinomortierella wolfii]|nr:hypothetical protein BGW42_008205 [Actinomortierella wolfii]